MRIGVSTKPLVQRWFILVAAVVGSGLVHHPARAEPADLQLARLAPDQETPTQLGPLPRPLGFADIVRYRQIFALAARGRLGRGRPSDRPSWTTTLLLGHVLADRYLHPTAYRSSYVELTAWLERYADLPQAAQIYRLAIGRKPAGAKKPPAPVEAAGIGGAQAGDGAGRPGARELWRKGVAAWRAGDAENAAESFTRLADDESLDGEDLARAAFWAARADLRARRPQFVARFLRMAARSSDEFYGLLAQKTLDERIDFDWREEQLKESMLDLLIRYPAVQRAIALVHVGETELADGEVRRLADRARPELAQALVSLAAHAGAAVGAGPAGAAGQPRRRAAPRRRQLPTAAMAAGRRLQARAQPGSCGHPRRKRFRRGCAQRQGCFGADAGHARHRPARGQAHEAGLQRRGLAAGAHQQHGRGPSLAAAAGRHAHRRQQPAPPRRRLQCRRGPVGRAGSPRISRTLRRTRYCSSRACRSPRRAAYAKKVMANLWAYQARSGDSIPSLQALAENRWPEVEPVLAAVPHPKAKPYARAN